MTKPERSEALERGVRFFTREAGIMTGLSVACGAGDRLACAMDGEVSERSVFDLASVTKLFTALCAMRLRETGRLELERPVTDYEPRFCRLGGVTVEQVMSFAVSLQTPVRIDACPDRASGEQALFETASAGAPGKRAYSDIPAMVMKYVIEAAAQAPFHDCVRRMILEPAGMEETWARVPEARRGDCQRYDPEYRLERGRAILRTGIAPGTPHDPKAALLQGDSGDLCGHAGLFSTRGDLIRFCRAVLAEKIVSAESLREMAVNRTGRPWPEGGYTQYLGYLCYVKHPDQYYSEIPVYMGCRAFGIGGFTGNHLAVDPERGLFTVFLGNRVRGRLTFLIPEEGKTLTDYGLRPDGTGAFRWEDGQSIPSSVQYVHQKDAHFHRAVAETLSLPELPGRRD